MTVAKDSREGQSARTVAKDSRRKSRKDNRPVLFCTMCDILVVVGASNHFSQQPLEMRERPRHDKR